MADVATSQEEGGKSETGKSVSTKCNGSTVYQTIQIQIGLEGRDSLVMLYALVLIGSNYLSWQLTLICTL